MNEPAIQQQRQSIRRGLLRANTAVAVILILLLALAVTAVLQSQRSAGSRRRAEQAEQEGRERLWPSLLAQARAVRAAELVKHPQDWPFAGAVVPWYPAVHPLEQDFWPLFWKLYLAARAPDAGNIRRPPLSGPEQPA
jgi:hypothetical protein